MTTREPYRPQRVGNMRERVTLQERVETESPSGEPITVYETIEEVWARVEPLKGEEKITAAQIVAMQRFNIFIRSRDDVTVLHRVQWNGIDLDVTATSNPDERKRFLQIDCEASV